MASNPNEDWVEKVGRKRAAQEASLQPYLDQTPTDIDDSITSIADVATLAGRVAQGDFTTTEVVSAYIRKAVDAHQKTNCLTEILFDEAREQARQHDAYYAEHKRPVGPLHGVVMTLKDQFNVKGHDTSLGYVGRAFHPAQEDALLATILKNAGVIFIAKTNLPQTIMWCETENPLFGLTTHPLDASLTPGGSTGGEGALLSLHGSLVGWGTDIGGSVRIPSHMTGLYALKPSSGRIPYLGIPVSTEGQEHIPSVVGPMARSLSSILTATKTVISANPWTHDPRVLPIPWRQDQYHSIQTRPLVIGLLLDDNVVKPHPPIQRVLREAAAKLTAAGHEIIPWNASDHQACIEIMDKYYTADGCEDLRLDIAAAGEPMIPHVAALVSRGEPISVYQYWQLNRAKQAAQKSYLDKWRSTRSPISGREIDVLLMPTMPHPAVPHRCCKWVGYTKIWNFLDYSAVVLPFGRVDKGVDRPGMVHEPRNGVDKANWALWDVEKMDGLPVSVQIVGRRLEEEKVLGAAEVVERVLRG
ncbi:hypothetical protein LTR62_006991 [Meristemomyces frigidus]|uniref:Amidase domain-containing protein n=1 Tax=Meristemomyces frigidus TaxID=1508187 RepID=A0AAN7TBE1_9PEZI|nr:hypothetical protein LTR62_006991 [Meristemomyces frigidus]